MPRIERSVARIKRALAELGDMRPGSLSVQTRKWGGEYFQLSYTHRGKGHTEYVPQARRKTVELQIAGPYAWGERPQPARPAQNVPAMKISEIELLSSQPSRASAWQINFQVDTLQGLKNILVHLAKTGMAFEFGLEQ